MKYFFLTAFACCLFSNSAAVAQKFGAGIVLGTSYNRSYVEHRAGTAGYGPAAGLILGGYGSYQRHRNLGLRSELLFQSMGYKTQNITFQQKYLAFSLLPRIIFIKSLIIEGGAIGGLALNKSLPNRTSTHFMWQAGFAISIKRFELSTRYFQSFAPFYTETTALTKRNFFNRGVLFTASYRIL
jgi:hypothetical protein